MYKVVVSSFARNSFRELSKIYKKAFLNVLGDLIENPHVGKALTREQTGNRSYRISLHRIIYRIDEQNKVVYIIKAGPRAKIYK